jgi:hypothetical protein
MNLEDALLDYARAWVALHAKQGEAWTRAQVFDAFYLLPKPGISFRDWVIARGLDLGQATESEPESSEPMREPIPGVVDGPGYCIASGPDAERIIEEKIQRMTNKAKEMGNA